MGTDNIRMTETGDVRQQILEVLLKERDAFISGNELSQRTGVSRTAVWKHIKALETAGFRFASSTRVGYRLTEVPDLLFPALVAERVPAGQHIGRKVVWYSEVDSTNRVAADWVQENAPHGTVVTAETQTGGKGRRGRGWFSPAGGLWLSVIFRAPIPVRVAADLTLLTSVAVRRAIVQETGLPVQIKWPNDLLLHGKKICGILAEIRADGETLQHAVIGVGLNSNIPAAAFPHALTDYATSLAAYSDQPISNLQLAGRLFSELEQLFQGLILHGQGFGHVLDEWRAASATLGRRVRVQTPQGLVEGVATDINAGGILYVRQDNGLVVPIHSGDVLF